MTKRWDTNKRDRVESPSAVESFLDSYEELCQKHGLSLSHEDDQGAFIITEYNVRNIDWVRNASLKIKA
jgi:hypothetical protein